MKADERKEMIRRGFNTVADNYDHPALRFFPRTAASLLDYLEPDPAGTLLDVCTGTGAVALAAAERMPQGRVTGIDLSSGMLAQARNKSASLNLSNVDFREMDLDHLHFEGKRFDAATCSFGLFFLDDMVAGLRNIAETVQPGGRVAISSFVEHSFEPYAEMFLSLVTEFGGNVGPLSWKRLADDGQIREVFGAVGIDEVKVQQVPMGFPLESEQQWWDVVWNAGFRSLLNQFDEAQIEQFRRMHLAAVREHHRQEDNRLSIDVIMAVGTVAGGA